MAIDCSSSEALSWSAFSSGVNRRNTKLGFSIAVSTIATVTQIPRVLNRNNEPTRSATIPSGNDITPTAENESMKRLMTRP